MSWLKSLFSQEDDLPLTQEQLDKLATGNYDNYYQNSWDAIFTSFRQVGLTEEQAKRETDKRRWHNKKND